MLSLRRFACSAGIIQADALLANQLTAQPSLITIPSGINQPYVSTLTVAWEGPAHSDRFVTYNITHVPAYSVPLDKGWYGNRYESRRVAFAAAVAVQPSQVVLDTTNTHPVKIKVGWFACMLMLMSLDVLTQHFVCMNVYMSHNRG